MSIAVSAVIHPSRILFFSLAGMSLLFALFAGIAAFGGLGEFFWYGRELIVVGYLLKSAFLMVLSRRNRKIFQITISGTGQIRLQEMVEKGEEYFLNETSQNQDGEEFFIAKGSTIWPNLIFLHLKSDKRRKVFVRIFSDSVTKNEFRALYVACRWIIAHLNEERGL